MTDRIRGTPPPTTPPPKPESNRLIAASTQLIESMENFSDPMNQLLKNPHLSDSPQALQMIARVVQELDKSSQEAINIAGSNA